MPQDLTRPVRTGDVVSLLVDNLAFGGDAVGRLDGFTVFVPGAVPGETVRVRIVQVKESYARAELLAVESVSPDRRAPECPIFHDCGGCHLQHLDYARQLTAKRRMVVDALERIGRLPGVTVQPCLPSPKPYRYRNKSVPVVSMRDGHFTAGIYRPRSHKLVPYFDCPIQTGPVNALIREALRKAEIAGLTPYEERTHTGFLRHLVVRHSEATGQMLLGFVTNGEVPAERRVLPETLPEPADAVLPRIASELLAETPGLAGVLQNVNPFRTHLVLGPETRLLAGKDRYAEVLDDLKLEVSLESFLQVNSGQAAILHEVVREALGRPGDRRRWGTVLDLYTGVGTLALVVSAQADAVVGVEEVAPAVEDARRNAERNHKRNVEFLQGDVGGALLALRAQGLQSVDAAVLDPPRRGVPPEVLARLAALAPHRLVYVSCDPATLARDLALLSRHGFTVDWVQPLDMFPQTYHVEAVARLTRNTPTALEAGEAAQARPAPWEPFRLPAPPSLNLAPLRGWLASAVKAARNLRPRSETSPAVEAFPLPAPLPPKPAFVRRRWALAGLALCAAAGAVVLARATFTFAPDLPKPPEAVPDLIAVLPHRAFARYELVPFEIRLGEPDLPYLSRMSAVVEVFREGRPVASVDDRYKTFLRRDAGIGGFRGSWPLPYNPPPGTYTARVSVFAPHWESPRTFESAFTVEPLAPRWLPKGYAVLTLEGGSRIRDGRIPSPDGSGEPAPENAVKWAKWMGADAFCFLTGQTSLWGTRQPETYPFSAFQRRLARRFAKAAKEAGLAFGAYVTAFKVVGDAWEQADYRFCLRYDSENDRLIPTRHIALDDSLRLRHLIALLRDLEHDPLVDMIGLDYVRTGFGGYEMADEFLAEMSLPVPRGFAELPPEERQLWLARTIELHRNERYGQLFNWWRARKVALTLKKVLEEAEVTKPVFTFTLGWEMGHQHGQDPAMFVDAGVGVNHIMLYERTADQMHAMTQQWPPYLARGNGMYVMGEMVDFRWMQNSTEPPAPEEAYRRMMYTFRDWFRVNARLGMFWHDLYRMLYGVKGPYSTFEWAVAGGKAFTEMRRAQGVLPVDVRVRAPGEAPFGEEVPLTVELHNRSEEDWTGLLLHHLDPHSDRLRVVRTFGPFDLPKGSRLTVEDFRLSLPEGPTPARANRYMAAVLLEDPSDHRRRAFDFLYVRAVDGREYPARQSAAAEVAVPEEPVVP